MGLGLSLSLCVSEHWVQIASHSCWAISQHVQELGLKAGLVEVVCFKGAFSTFTNSSSKCWVKAGVNAEVNLRIARRATLGVLFSGEKATIQMKCSCCGISCTGRALHCAVLVTFFPGVEHTHGMSFPAKSMCCQYKQICTEGLQLAQFSPAQPHLFPPPHMPVTCAWPGFRLNCSFIHVSEVLVTVGVGWHSPVHNPQPLNVTLVY